MPAPTIEGRVVSIRVEGDKIIEVFGAGAPAAPPKGLVPPDADAPNYMYYKGGALIFGRMEMRNAEMQIVDLDPADPFEFDLDRYQGQLIAGYSKTLADGGLEVHMRDVDKVESTTPRN